jgi:cytochrome P450
VGQERFMRVISDYELSRAIVSSRAFRAYPMADGYKELAARFGHDFGASIAVLERLPTFMDGEAHRAMREAMARVFAAIRQPQLAVAREFLAEFAAARLRPGEQFDLMGDLARPMFRAMTGVAVTARQVPEAITDLVADVPLLFSPFTSLKTRLEINARLTALLAQHGEEIICDLGLLVLGVRPLTGGLARTLHVTVSGHQGQPLSAMAWPTRIALSPVTYVDRICLEPVTLAGEDFAAGEYLRCRIHVPEWTAEQRQTTMFGVGSHLCLGRPISELVWTAAVELFAAQDLRATAGPYSSRQGSDPFDLPAHCPISIEP